MTPKLKSLAIALLFSVCHIAVADETEGDDFTITPESESIFAMDADVPLGITDVVDPEMPEDLCCTDSEGNEVDPEKDYYHTFEGPVIESDGSYTLDTSTVSSELNDKEVTAHYYVAWACPDEELSEEDYEEMEASAVYTVVKVTIGKDEEGAGTPNRYVDRVDPTHNWTNNSAELAAGQILYSGVTTGDYAAWVVNVQPEAAKDLVTNYKWTADGKSELTGPEGAESIEWNDGGGGLDCYEWIPGAYTLHCTATFTVGEKTTNITDDYAQTVGLRTKDIVAVGWINRHKVPLSTTGVHADVLQYFPPGGFIDIPILDQTVGDFNQRSWTTLYLASLATGFTWRPSPPLLETLDPINAADREYILNWNFKYAPNNTPPGSFANEEALVAFKDAPTSYKLLNRFQIQSKITDDGLFDTPTVLKNWHGIGITLDPIWHTDVAGVAGPNNGATNFDNGIAGHINDGTPDSVAVSMFNTLMAPLKWSNIGSCINFDTAGEYEVLMQVYPTYYIYERLPDGSFQLRDTVDQAPNPKDNFNSNPYPSGPAPYIPEWAQ